MRRLFWPNALPTTLMGQTVSGAGQQEIPLVVLRRFRQRSRQVSFRRWTPPGMIAAGRGRKVDEVRGVRRSGDFGAS